MSEAIQDQTESSRDIGQDQKTKPMMAQWSACKKTAGDAVLLFRLGDFYEAFHEDALLISRELDLTLTKRHDIPMSGIPHHTSEAYIDKLVSKGYRVAVAEQIEDPRTTKGLVKREIVRIVTPGTLMTSSLLSDKANNFVAAIARVGALFGLAVLDLTTANFHVIELDKEQDLVNELYRLQPSEILVSPKFKEKQQHLLGEVGKSYNFLLSTHDDWRFEHQTACDFLTAHLRVKTLDGFGLRGMVAAINAAGALLNYLQESLCLSIGHITEIKVCLTAHYMAIDRATQRHLELTESLQDGSRRNTLLNLLDKTCTPMGARLMRHWVKQPLLDTVEIKKRQDAIQAFYSNTHLHDDIATHLEGVRDLERLMTKVCAGYALPRDLVALKNSLLPIAGLKMILQQLVPLSEIIACDEGQLENLPEMIQLISHALVEEPPARLNEGKIFRDGYCQELDELREISRDSKAWLVRYQSELKETTGIKTLKVSFNKMFGYYIEVSRGQADKMPEKFQRRQTLVNAERYVTPELKEYESKVLNAEERTASIEAGLFAELRLEIAKFGERVQRTAQAISRLDSLQGLAATARQYDYTRPIVDNGLELKIGAGRHPIIEASENGERFIANDTFLDNDKQRLLLITGPNMAGKSTYIRQVALIAIMAQIGSFVPAASAHLGIIDKVFSRIGASDDLSRGQSTFMVEMTETANILNNATSRSLVILDEIGRGTSTYDGISIAWAVAEYLLTTDDKMAKTLFATHYCELTKLEEKVPGAVNYSVAVHESDDSIIFLRKIIRGGTDKSYGIHVGRLAGLPQTVIARAKEILVHLEENANRKSAFEPSPPKRTIAQKAKSRINIDNMQMTFFS